MDKPIETIDLGDRWEFEANGRTLRASVELRVWWDAESNFDGDDPEDIAAFERGEFDMYTAKVTATFAGLEGSDSLSGIAASKLQDVTDCVEEYGLVSNALSDLANKVERIVVAANA